VPDECDIAQFFIPEVNAEEISKKFLQPSEEFCIDCDEEIPAKRRSLGGVERCIHCQEFHEKNMKKM
jgi:RNA polymerase-binding transcription factor DksA